MIERMKFVYIALCFGQGRIGKASDHFPSLLSLYGWNTSKSKNVICLKSYSLV